MSRKILLYLLFCSISLTNSAQITKMDHARKDGAQHDISLSKDSLKLAMETGDDNEIYDALTPLYVHYNSTTEWDSLIRYTQMTNDYAEKVGDVEIHLKTLIGLINLDKMIKKDYSREEERIKYLLEYYNNHQISQKRRGEICEMWAGRLERLGLQDSAILVQTRAVDHLVQVDDMKGLEITAIMQLGVYLQNAKRYDEALDRLLEAERLMEGAAMPRLVQFNVRQTIGQLFFRIGDYDKSLFYFDKARKIAEESGFKTSMHKAILYLGRNQHFLGENVGAEANFRKAVSYFRSRPGSAFLAESYIYLAHLYKSKEEYEIELKYLDSVKIQLDLSEDLQLRGIANRYYRSMAEFSLRKGNIEQAKANMAEIKRKSLVSSTGGPDIGKLQYQIAKEEGNYKQALSLFETYKLRRDSANNRSVEMNARRLESEYNRKQQTAEISNLNELNTAQEKGIAVRNTALALGGLMLLILAGLLFGLYRLFKKYRANQAELSEQNIVISKALEDNQMLIKEIHHRVKNNLQVVSSLLSMQARKVSDGETKDALNSSKTRVQSMSILHQNLYQGDDLKDVDVSSYLDKLIANISDTYHVDEKIKVSIEVDPIALDVDTLVPLGLMTNELVCNAVKHAFKGRENGMLSISLKDHEDTIVLAVKDDGVGIEGKELPMKQGSLGARLIKSFADRLDGVIEIDNEGGTAIMITFEKASLLGEVGE